MENGSILGNLIQGGGSKFLIWPLLSKFSLVLPKRGLAHRLVHIKKLFVLGYIVRPYDMRAVFEGF
jgi:hypothetical protein